MPALLAGCGLRRGELLSLNMRSIQMREEHWVVADLPGKAGHIRTIPIPIWVKAAIDQWTSASLAMSRFKTTERYLGCKQRLRHAVNDKLGLEP